MTDKKRSPIRRPRVRAMPAVGECDTIRRVRNVPTLWAGDRPLAAPVFCLFYDQALRDNVVTTLYRNGIRAFAVRTFIGAGASEQTDESLEVAVRRIANAARRAPEAHLIADCLFSSEPARPCRAHAAI